MGAEGAKSAIPLGTRPYDVLRLLAIVLGTRVLIEASPLMGRDLLHPGPAVSCVRAACVCRASVHTRLANLTHHFKHDQINVASMAACRQTNLKTK